MNKVETYIRENWKNTVKTTKEDCGTLIGLPKPYTTPCIGGKFQEMYYWDTYFTNIGLMLSGNFEQAKNNIDNMIYLINRYGKMPNGNRSYYLNRSQPPFLSQMVREFYSYVEDKEWLRTEAFPALEKEYDFWQTKRSTKTGLNSYGGLALDEETLYKEVRAFCSRIGWESPKNKESFYSLGQSMYAIAESGWDCSSRFAVGTHLYNVVDLNSLLFLLESNMQYFSTELGYADKAEIWELRKKVRKEKMNDLMWNNERKCFCDFQYERKSLSDLYSAATYYPMFVKMCSDKQAKEIVSNLYLLEMEYGIAGCEKRNDVLELQWDYPNGWACLQYITAKGLLDYGYREDALRIAEKFINIVERNYLKTGNLWEKYNVVTGEISVTKEYETPPMMGWTAGIYIYFIELLKIYGIR